MIFIPYALWPVVGPVWGQYFQECIDERLGKGSGEVQQIFLLVDDQLSSQWLSDSGLNVREFVAETKWLHALAFQSPEFRLGKTKSVLSSPAPEFIQQWGKEQNALCQSQFFLGYHPWFGQSNFFEFAGDRWWPTRAWCRGWSWQLNCSAKTDNSPATIRVLVSE